jgi:formyltetrahydrofolate synthetase
MTSWRGIDLRQQIANIRRHGVTPVIAVNAFPTDYDGMGDHGRRGEGRCAR